MEKSTFKKSTSSGIVHELVILEYHLIILWYDKNLLSISHELDMGLTK